MRFFLIPFVFAAFLFSACSSSSSDSITDAIENATEAVKSETPAPARKKYQIKSGTITYENSIAAGQFSTVHKSIVYFDDYGIKERKDTYDDQNQLKESFFSDGSNLYLLIHNNKEAYNRGSAYRGTEYKFDWNEISEDDKAAGKAEKAANESIAGKDCEVYYYDSGLGKTKFAGWNNICLLTDISSVNGQSVNRAIEITEGAVDPSLFKVPEGYEMKKL